MEYFRNPEIKKEFTALFFLEILFGITAGFLFGYSGFIFEAVLFLIFTFFHFGTSYRRYNKIAELAKEINGFCLQPIFILAPNLKYKADFIIFHKDGSSEVIDVKGFKTKEYIVKKKVFEDKYNLKITEI